MWDDLYRVDWHSLVHAYGKARDVPQMLHDIVDADEDTREGGWDQFSGAVNHQGDFYDSTVAAIPLLIEAVAQPALPGRAAILDYFRERWSDMPLYGGDPLVPEPPGGADIPTPMLSAEEAASRAEAAADEDEGDDTDEEEDECDVSSYRRMDLCAWQTGRAIQAAQATFAALLDDPDRKVRAAAAFLLLIWRETRPAAKRALLRMIAEEHGADEQSRLILQFGVYASEEDKPYLTAWIAPERPAVVRAASVLVWARLIEPEPLPASVASALEAVTIAEATAFGDLPQAGVYLKRLWDLPSNTAPAVLRLMDSHNDELRWRATQALAHHRWTSRHIAAAEAVAVLLRRLTDDYNRIRAAAAQALADRGDAILDVAPDAVPALVAALDAHTSRDWGDSAPSLDLPHTSHGHVARLLAACAPRLSPGQRREAARAIEDALRRAATQDSARVTFVGLAVPAATFLKKQHARVAAAQPWVLGELFAEYFLSGRDSDTTLSSAACDRALAEAYATAPEKVLEDAARVMTGTDNRHGAVGAALWLTTLGPAAAQVLDAVEHMATGRLDSYATGQARLATSFIRQALTTPPRNEVGTVGNGMFPAQPDASGLRRAREDRSAAQDRDALIEALSNGLAHDDPDMRATAAEGLAALAPLASAQIERVASSLRLMLGDETTAEIGIAERYFCRGRLYHCGRRVRRGVGACDPTTGRSSYALVMRLARYAVSLTAQAPLLEVIDQLSRSASWSTILSTSMTGMRTVADHGAHRADH